MKSKNVLIPLDLMRSPCDALVYAREMATEQVVSVTLLYVLNLNIAVPDRSVFTQLEAEGEAALRKLARLFFGSDKAVRVAVRSGMPHEEILAEARETGAELIVLSKAHKRTWNNFLRANTAQKIIDSAPCPTMVLPGSGYKAPQFKPLPAYSEAQLAEAV
jgi:nucleotide-binding universal stress UspA family protein